MAGPTIEKVDLDNQELQQALQIVQFTHNSLFLTGKAGTGLAWRGKADGARLGMARNGMEWRG